jgi:phosphatidylglycerol:prolipoprotein diacylglycerol transferase
MDPRLHAIFWDPNPDIFTIPFLDLPLRWYGLFFSFGLFVGCLIFIPLLKHLLLKRGICDTKDLGTYAYAYMDKLLWIVVIGIVVGARLGHVFFYDWPYYKEHLSEIPKVWHGGLASHGGTVGLLVSLYFFAYITRKNHPRIGFIDLCDLLAIPTAFAVTSIRIGNFFNQEIVGIPSEAPWAVTFGHPADHVLAVPRHPVQLYEALAYFITFIILMLVWFKKKENLKPGLLTGLVFIMTFGSRIVIEFLNEPLGAVMDETYMQTGQILSLPFIAIGLYLCLRRDSSKLCKT